MTTEDIEASQSGGDEVGVGGPGAPTPLSALEVGNVPRLMLFSKYILTKMIPQGVAGLTKRDIQLVIDGGYNTVESVAYTPRRILERIKGISEQKATKILTEGLSMISV